MRKLSSLLLILLIGVIGVGCDSDNSQSDAEAFVGVWALTGVSDAGGDALAAFGAAFSSVTLDNGADGSFTLVATPRQGTAVTVPGTYSVNESTNTFTLTTPQAPLAFTYTYTSDNVVELQAGATTSVLLNSLFGTSLEAPSTITITRQ
jgi:hypothetical protein